MKKLMVVGVMGDDIVAGIAAGVSTSATLVVIVKLMG